MVLNKLCVTFSHRRVSLLCLVHLTLRKSKILQAEGVAENRFTWDNGELQPWSLDRVLSKRDIMKKQHQVLGGPSPEPHALFFLLNERPC